MALVSYSDSESESESSVPKDQPSASANQSTSANSSKAGFQKVVNRAEPHKIKVSLSSLAQKGSTGDSEEAASERPTKRAKTGGAFSDFNSFLPAPKNPAKSTNISAQSATGQSGSRSTSLGPGFSLKTGAEPAFRRDEAVIEERTEDYAKADSGSTSQVVKTEDVKIVGSNIMFMPLSVSRNQKKKKPSVSNATPLSTPAAATSGAQRPPPVEPAPKKPKKSLFSVAEEEPAAVPQAESSEYQPMFGQDEPAGEENNMDNGQTDHGLPTNQGTGGQSLEELANSMGLSASDRRQLFGRSGKPTDVQVTQFSLAAEYARNREMLEKQDTTPQHNAVKSIAPGKHSLQQLMKAASNNKDALEESFVRGKNNKKEAGNKYGW